MSQISAIADSLLAIAFPFRSEFSAMSKRDGKTRRRSHVWQWTDPVGAAEKPFSC
jgi:hypothetical protein